MYFLIHPLGWINDERMAVHCLESGCIELSIPSDLEISLSPRNVPRPSPSGHLSASGNLLVVGDVQPNTSLPLAVYVYNMGLHWVEIIPKIQGVFFSLGLPLKS